MNKKYMVAVSLGLLCVGMLAGCGKSESPLEDMEYNPVQEMSKDEMVQASMIDLDAPAGAENVKYNLVTLDNGVTVPEVVFDYDGHSYFYRATMTNEIDLSNTSAINISGINVDYSNYDETAVSTCEAQVYLSEEEGFITWLDVVPGIIYNVGSNEATDADALTQIADVTFVSAQGEVGPETKTYRITCKNEDCKLFGQPSSLDSSDPDSLTCPTCGGEVDVKEMDE